MKAEIVACCPLAFLSTASLLGLFSLLLGDRLFPMLWAGFGGRLCLLLEGLVWWTLFLAWSRSFLNNSLSFLSLK